MGSCEEEENRRRIFPQIFQYSEIILSYIILSMPE